MSEKYRNYEDISIMDAARRCGIVLNGRTLGRKEVEAVCPFCGDKHRRHHLYLNTEKNQYYCWLCGASGNSVSLYARLQQPPLSYREAARELLGGSNIYRLPSACKAQITAGQPLKLLAERHEIFTAMLELLDLNEAHRENLQQRGFSPERIKKNMYCSLSMSEHSRMLVAGMLADFYCLDDMPGFYKNNMGKWTLAGKPGILIPYRDKDGLIQGIQIRLDDETDPKRKYRWFASTDLASGTKSGSWIHITGNTQAKTAVLLEGALKGDVSAFFDEDALFICFAGINAIGGLREVIESLGVKDLIIAADMDKVSNWRVRNGLNNIVKAVSAVKGLKIRHANWDVSLKGLDDYYLARSKNPDRGRIINMPQNDIAAYLLSLWKKEYPQQDPGFIQASAWEEKLVPLKSLIIDLPNNSLNLDKVKLFKAHLEAGTEFPPIVCVNGYVIDGAHRCRAYAQTGCELVRVYQNIPWTQKRAA